MLRVVGMRFRQGMSLLVAFGIGPVACNRRLDDIKPLSQLAPDITVLLQGDSGGATVLLLPSESTSSESCFALGDGTLANLNGTELRLADFGGWKTNRSGAESCSVPYFELPTVPSSAGVSTDTLTIADGSATWTVVVENFTAAREVRREVPIDGNVRAGDWVTLAVTPPDRVVLASVDFYTNENPTRTNVAGEPAPEFHYDEVRGSAGATGQVVEFDESRFRFLMGNAPTGAAHIDGKVGLDLPIQLCDGPKACEVEATSEFEDVPVSVVP